MPYAMPICSTKPGTPTYRAEFNVMSGRWMVLDGNDQCHRAGLSEHKAKEVVFELTQAQH